MLKKKLILLLSLILMFSLVSCGSDSGEAEGGDSDATGPDASTGRVGMQTESRNEDMPDEVEITMDGDNIVFTITGYAPTAINEQIATLDGASDDAEVDVNFYFKNADNTYSGYMAALLRANGENDMSLSVKKDGSSTLASDPMDKGASFEITDDAIIFSAPVSYYEGYYDIIASGEVVVTDMEDYIVHSSMHEFE